MLRGHLTEWDLVAVMLQWTAIFSLAGDDPEAAFYAIPADLATMDGVET